MGVAFDIVEVDLLCAATGKGAAGRSYEVGGDSLSSVVGVDVDEVDESDGAGGDVGAVGDGGVDEGYGGSVDVGDEGGGVWVVEHGVYLLLALASSLFGDLPDVGVGGLVVGLEGVAHLYEVESVFWGGGADGWHGCVLVCYLYNWFACTVCWIEGYGALPAGWLHTPILLEDE